MGAFWLKMIGTATQPCPEPYALPYADFTRNPRRMRPRDRLVLYAVGGRKRVFALATVTSAERPSGVERWPFRVDIEYELNVLASDGIRIETVKLEHLMPAIRFGTSHLSLTEDEFDYAAAKLRALVNKQ
jgi:hypothetical protein